MNKLDIPKRDSVGSISEDELRSCTAVATLRKIHNELYESRSVYLEILEGDYAGSVAKFTVDENEFENRFSKDNNFSVRCYGSGANFNIKEYWCGRLSWKGKRNNPQFTLRSGSARILKDHSGHTNLVRFNMKAEKEKLLKTEVHDIDGNTLSVGDEVLYMNLRYGSGGKLCHGEVKEFKAHARQGFVSVVISNSDGSDESECKHPDMQIFKRSH